MLLQMGFVTLIVPGKPRSSLNGHMLTKAGYDAIHCEPLCIWPGYYRLSQRKRAGRQYIWAHDNLVRAVSFEMFEPDPIYPETRSMHHFPERRRDPFRFGEYRSN